MSDEEEEGVKDFKAYAIMLAVQEFWAKQFTKVRCTVTLSINYSPRLFNAKQAEYAKGNSLEKSKTPGTQRSPHPWELKNVFQPEFFFCHIYSVFSKIQFILIPCWWVPVWTVSVGESQCQNVLKLLITTASRYKDNSPCSNHPLKCPFCWDNTPFIWK